MADDGGGGSTREESSLDEVLAGYLDRLSAGEMLDREEIQREHPLFADELLERLEMFQFVGSTHEEEEDLGTLGDYRLLRQVGRGGMGIVYEAWQNSMERRVALKVLPAGIAADTRMTARFIREAHAAGKLNHRNVVPVYGMGVEAGTPYYAMLTGQSPRKLSPL